MTVECRVDRIEAVAPDSHADFMFRSVLCTLIRVADGRVFRVKMPQSVGLRPGEIVQVERWRLNEGLV
jgi:hypothetical protein